MSNENTFEPCGLGSCAAEDGHDGTCAQASGWAEEPSVLRLSATIVDEHRFVGVGIPQGTKVIYSCSCGVPLEESEKSWGRHLVEATELAVRAQIAGAVAARAAGIDLKAVGYDEGAADAYDIAEQIARGEIA